MLCVTKNACRLVHVQITITHKSQSAFHVQNIRPPNSAVYVPQR